jgi:SAM-dependent methyltransferase
MIRMNNSLAQGMGINPKRSNLQSLIIRNTARIIAVSFLFVVYSTTGIQAQHRDVPFVPTPYETVEEMLKLADVGPGDYVIDLGSGDGRIVIAAARRGAYGHGIDIDPKRISEAKKNASKAGMENRVLFMEGNLFETDFSRASVITMYLLNSVNMKLRPNLLKNLRPGTRIVSYYFNMNDWEPDKRIEVNNSDVYFWIIPARVEGKWNWQTDNKKFAMTAKQEFQKITLDLKADNTNMKINESHLSGDKLTFTATHPSDGTSYVFSGRVEGNKVTGMVQTRKGENNTVENWDAVMN